MATPEFSVYIRERRIGRRRERRIRKLEKQLVNIVFTQTFNPPDTDETTNWLGETLVIFNSLPKGNSAERRKARNLVTQTAKRLLESPQDITIAQKTWRGNELSRDGAEKPQEPFSELIRKECLTLIKEKWEDVKPEQLAQLVRISTDDNDPSQNDAKEMLRNYFRGPSSRRQRINACYTLACSALHLIEDDKAFMQAIRIGLHDTDILPKDPYLIEQTLLLSLPYFISLPYNNEEKRDFQKLLTAKYVIYQLSFLSLEDLGEARQRYSDFLNTDENLMKKWKEEIAKAEKKIGSAKVAEINEAARAFDVGRKDALPEEEKLKLKNTWPYNLLLDYRDPLNQKFEKVFSRISALKTMIPKATGKDL